MNAAAEEILSCILKVYNTTKSRELMGESTDFPAHYQDVLELEFNELSDLGLILNQHVYIDGTWDATLTDGGINYFEHKTQETEQVKTKEEKQINIGSIVVNGSNLVLGDVIDSSLLVDNSISRIEKEIGEKGGEEKEELQELLEEVKGLIENMQNSRHIPRNNGLFSKLSNHFEKHGWFYGEVVGLLGSAIMQMLPK